jgi:hypothetical protein
VQLGQERPLGEHRGVRGGIAVGVQHLPQLSVSGTQLNTHGPLPRGRREIIKREQLGDAVLQPKAPETGRCQHDRV